MARYTGPKGKLVRRFGVNIFGNDKYDRLLERRSDGPGQHGANQSRRKKSDYALQLIEKQKLRCSYGLLEKQFRRTFHRARQMRGVTGDNLLLLLESRLDSVVYRAGFGRTLFQARQMVNHGHFQVNGRRVDIPSCQIKPGDIVSVRDTAKSKALATRTFMENPRTGTPEWMSVDVQALQVKINRMPMRDEIPSSANEQLIVELYSK